MGDGGGREMNYNISKLAKVCSCKRLLLITWNVPGTWRILTMKCSTVSVKTVGTKVRQIRIDIPALSLGLE